MRPSIKTRNVHSERAEVQRRGVRICVSAVVTANHQAPKAPSSLAATPRNAGNLCFLRSRSKLRNREARNALKNVQRNSTLDKRCYRLQRLRTNTRPKSEAKQCFGAFQTPEMAQAKEVRDFVVKDESRRSQQQLGRD
jgi:hypothetical protein